MKRLLLVLMGSATAVAGAAAQSQTLPKDACPKLSSAERKQIEAVFAGNGIFPELAWYAREYCVSIAEAKRRMDIQNRDAIGAETEPGGQPPPRADSIGTISAAVEAKEAATFAGLWIQHQPDYRVVVAFTRDAARTLAKYTRNPLFKPLDRPGPTQADLRSAQQRLQRQLADHGARPTYSSSDIMKARVEIGVTGDLTAFRAAVARGEVKLPAYVSIAEPAPLAHAAPPIPPGNQVKAFPRSQYRSGGPEPDMLRTGTVVLEDGCLKLDSDRRKRVIVWPNEAALDLVSQPGAVRVMNRITGKSVDLNGRISMGGNARNLKDEAGVIDADTACPGPYFAMGNFGPHEPDEEGEIEGRATALMHSLRISKEEALRRARAEKAREARFYELGEMLLREAPDSFAAVYPYQGRATIKFARDPWGEAKRLIPADLLPFVKAERVPRPLAALKAERNALLDQVEAAGIEASVNGDIEAGRILLSSEDLPALSRAARDARIALPANVQVMSNGAMPAGEYSEARMQAANRALEAVPDWAELRVLVEASKVPGYLVTYKKGEPDRGPTRAQSLDITRYLVALGFTAADVRLLQAHGIDPARAWVQQNGRSTPANRAALVEEVIVGEVVGIDDALLGDGYRSTIRMRVAEGLKGYLKPGDEVAVRLVSGRGADGKYHQSNEEPMLLAGLPGAAEPGTRWLINLSQGMLDHQARRIGGKRPASNVPLYAALYGMWPVDGNSIGRTYSEPSPGSLPQLRSKLRPVDDAYEAATAKAKRRLMQRLLP